MRTSDPISARCRDRTSPCRESNSTQSTVRSAGNTHLLEEAAAQAHGILIGDALHAQARDQRFARPVLCDGEHRYVVEAIEVPVGASAPDRAQRRPVLALRRDERLMAAPAREVLAAPARAVARGLAGEERGGLEVVQVDAAHEGLVDADLPGVQVAGAEERGAAEAARRVDARAGFGHLFGV